MSNLDENSEVHKKSMILCSTFVRNIKHVRKKYNLTQTEMAELCNLSPQSYSDIERAYSIPSLVTACSISVAIGIDLKILTTEVITD